MVLGSQISRHVLGAGGVRLVVTGSATRLSPLPLGFAPAPTAGLAPTATAGQPPLLLTGDVAGLDRLAGLDGV